MPNIGYAIYRSTKKDGKYTKIATVVRNDEVNDGKAVTNVLVGKGSGNTYWGCAIYNDKKLTKNSTYYYKVRIFVNAGGKNYYGDYSNILKVKLWCFKDNRQKSLAFARDFY